MKSVAIIQARMSSERLPGKVLKPLSGKPVLAHVIGRLRRAQLLDAVMVATSDGADDDPVAAPAKRASTSLRLPR
jgi:spore coat polysaccharide biosynthesis protein SpsF